MGMMDGLRRVTRGQRMAMNNLGFIELDRTKTEKKFRDPALDKLDSYYDSTQYEKMPSWDISNGPDGQYIQIRKRQPRFKVAFAKSLSQRVASKLIGDSHFPTMLIQDSPDDQEFIKAVIRESKIKSRILEPIRRCINTGSVFVRFYISGGALKMEWYNAKYCYPEFGSNGELSCIEIKYVYDDKEDKDSLGNPKKKWYKIELCEDSEILYDNPEFEEGKEPIFQEVQRVEHGLGFVQGEWFRTCENPNSPDGYGITSDIMDFIDELNYSLSQSSQAVSYNQDPQLALNGMDEDELGNLIRSSTKSWNLGRDGKAQFLETNLGGVERAIELRDKVRLNISDITRVVLLDPEKIVGSAQSGKSMEVLHGPLVDLVNELRGPIGESLKNLVLKMGLAMLIASKQGIDIPIQLPPGYVPQSMQVDLSWSPIFQQTMTDLMEKVKVAAAVSTANLISRDTLTHWLAKDFGVDNVEEELQKIASQPILNPFMGGF